MNEIDILETHKVHGGPLSFVRHASAATGTDMTFSIFVPEGEGPFATLYWLSGLTCSASNFTEKAGAYKKAAELGLIIVAPDTSPRGETVPNDPASDLGQGASFYVDATQGQWKTHFQMETYVVSDLIAVVEANFAADLARRGISGHSMGGHGALTIAMNHAHLFRSVSAFAPISAPSRCPWGQKAFGTYLGAEHANWERYDASILMAGGMAKPFDAILVDQGTIDPFLDSQLMPNLLEQAATAGGANLTVRYQQGYDHSYYFIQSFIDDHLAFHAEQLARAPGDRA